MVLKWERLQKTDRVETQFQEGNEMSDRESGSLSSVGPRQPPSLASCCCWKVTKDVVASNNEDPRDYFGPSRISKLAQDTLCNHVFNVPFLKSCVYPKKNGKWLNSLSKRSPAVHCHLCVQHGTGLGEGPKSHSWYGVNEAAVGFR